MRATETETHAVRLSMLASGLALALHVASRSLREGLFLATFTVGQLPKVMLGAAVFSVPMALLVTRAMARFGPGRVTPLMFVVGALASLLEWALLPALPRGIAIAFYFHVSIWGALLVSAFWSIVNERFDPHTLKSVVARIGGTSTLGGLCGGLLMERAVHWFTPRGCVLLLGALALAGAACTQLLGSAVPAARPDEEAAADAASDRLKGYLWTLALLVACSAALSAFGDFALKQAAAARLTNITTLVRFFAVFYTGAALASFLLQVLVSRRALDTIGVGGTLAVPPLLAIALGAISLFAPSLVTVGALRGADLALGPSLYRSAFEPLLTPVAAANKRRSKALIDVVFDKGGETLASLLILLLLAGSPLIIQRAPLVLVIVAAVLAVWLSVRAQRGYVSELEASLREGTAGTDVPGSTFLSLHLGSDVRIGRDKLSERLGQLRQARDSPGAASPLAAEPPAESVDDILTHVKLLLGSDVGQIRELLNGPPLDARLAAFVLPFLGRDDLAKPAVLALRNMGHGALGVLAEAMHSPSLPAIVKRRIPHVLRSARGDRVVRSLFWALSADAPEVRYRAALALAEVTREDKALLPDREQLDALVLSEIAQPPLTRPRIDHIFALLSLGMNRGALELARQGLLSDDRKLRGTALEYLESLLPEGVRSPLVTALGELVGPREEASEKHADVDLLDQLRRSFKADLAPPALATDPD